MGDLAGEAGRQPGVYRSSVPGPMMGDTPYGAVARRTRPSSVASLRGRATHAPADSRVHTELNDGHYHICLGRRREPQSGFPDGEGGEAGQRLVSKISFQDRFFDVLWSRSSSTPRRRRSSRSSPRTCGLFSEVHQRFGEQNHVAHVWRRRSPT